MLCHWGKKWKNTQQQKDLWIIFNMKFTSEDDANNFLDFKAQFTANKIHHINIYT